MKDKYNSFTGKIIPGVGYVKVPNAKLPTEPVPWKYFLIFAALAIVYLLTK